MLPSRQYWRTRAWGVVIAVAPLLISAVLTVLVRTLRVQFVDAGGLLGRWARGERVILAFWHNRVVMMPAQARGRNVCIMNSEHRDGEIATRALARWGIRSARGSATRGGVRGFLRLVDAYRAGFNLAVVPDGPRGPRYQVKPGVIYLAKVTGAPLFPVSYAASRKKQLRSWDQLIIPLPFARVVYVVGEPMLVPRDAGDAMLETMRAELEARLNRVTAEAEAAMHG